MPIHRINISSELMNFGDVEIEYTRKPLKALKDWHNDLLKLNKKIPKFGYIVDLASCYAHFDIPDFFKKDGINKDQCLFKDRYGVGSGKTRFLFEHQIYPTGSCLYLYLYTKRKDGIGAVRSTKVEKKNIPTVRRILKAIEKW